MLPLTVQVTKTYINNMNTKNDAEKMESRRGNWGRLEERVSMYTLTVGGGEREKEFIIWATGDERHFVHCTKAQPFEASRGADNMALLHPVASTQREVFSYLHKGTI